MSKRLVWWQAYKAALAGGCTNDLAYERANIALDDYIVAARLYGKEMAA